MSILHDVLQDRVTIVAADGQVRRRVVRASVQKDRIILGDEEIVIEKGDHILRRLPGGNVEDLVVDDAHYTAAGDASNWGDHRAS